MLAPVTVAKNCCVLAVPVDGARKAYGGEIAMATEPVGTVTVISAVAVREGSARLMAVSTTGFIAGGDAGAR